MGPVAGRNQVVIETVHVLAYVVEYLTDPILEL